MTNEQVILNLHTYNCLAEQYNSRFRGHPMEDDLISLLKTHVDTRCVKTALEIGPGAGFFSKLLCDAGISTTMIELAPNMARYAEQNAPKAKVIVDDVFEHDFSENRFDLIAAIQFIHLYKPEDMSILLRKIHSVLAPGGISLITTSLHQCQSAGLEPKTSFEGENIRYRCRFTSESFEDLINKSPFKILDYSELHDAPYGLKTRDYLRAILTSA